MFHLLWDDVAVDKDRFVAECDEEKYAALEQAGILHLVTARNNGELAGYFLVFVTPNAHYKGAGPMAFTDMYFLLPEYRKGNTGMKLFAFAEETWRQKGCVKAYTSHKLHRDRSTMFKLMGWKPTDMVYSKVL
jgi:GNAT superfamily N-acetyltransferase